MFTKYQQHYKFTNMFTKYQRQTSSQNKDTTRQVPTTYTTPVAR
jgi:hypothetical protein